MLKMLFSSAFAFSMLTSAALADAPGGASLVTVRYSGSGCPSGSVDHYAADDLSGIAVSFRDFVARGTVSPRLRETKDCRLELELTAPKGWSVALSDVTAQGGAELDRSATASHKISAGARGNSARAELLRIDLRGGYLGDYGQRGGSPSGGAVHSPCDGTKKVLKITAASSANGGAVLGGSGMSGNVEHFYGLDWQRCEPPAPASDEVAAVVVTNGLWDGNLNVCIDLRSGALTTQQVGTSWMGFVDLQLGVQTFGGSFHEVSVQGPAGMAAATLPGNWYRVAGASPQVLSWSRDGRGDDPEIAQKTSGRKRCLRLVDGTSRRPGPVTFAAGWNIERSEWSAW